MEPKHPIMLVGPAGSGKTVLITEKLASLNENYTVTNVPFNFYTTSGKYPDYGKVLCFVPALVN